MLLQNLFCFWWNIFWTLFHICIIFMLDFIDLRDKQLARRTYWLGSIIRALKSGAFGAFFFVSCTDSSLVWLTRRRCVIIVFYLNRWCLCINNCTFIWLKDFRQRPSWSFDSIFIKWIGNLVLIILLILLISVCLLSLSFA